MALNHCGCRWIAFSSV